MNINENYIKVAEEIYKLQKNDFISSLAERLQSSIQKWEQDIENARVMNINKLKARLSAKQKIENEIL